MAHDKIVHDLHAQAGYSLAKGGMTYGKILQNIQPELLAWALARYRVDNPAEVGCNVRGLCPSFLFSVI